MPQMGYYDTPSFCSIVLSTPLPALSPLGSHQRGVFPLPASIAGNPRLLPPSARLGGANYFAPHALGFSRPGPLALAPASPLLPRPRSCPAFSALASGFPPCSPPDLFALRALARVSPCSPSSYPLAPIKGAFFRFRRASPEIPAFCPPNCFPLFCSCAAGLPAGGVSLRSVLVPPASPPFPIAKANPCVAPQKFVPLQSNPQ